ncbi:hypothetical protein KUH03_03555 [Sphingobacterium sp. E70]|uniref:hypothetical protein n=1 Tax=Sphingobacterium sp. E70 TaxID=2853439 RepID=UPI00211BF840|nr:hypothetical protein [Sphingobacterium sp. E70]ULT26057.1 hypothetical protein KUH03_03555 [Sphingobacterium sp. E70]
MTKTLTADEANHVIKNKKQELVAFVERELQEAANDLQAMVNYPQQNGVARQNKPLMHFWGGYN